MSSILRISDAATLALHATVYLAGHQGDAISTKKMAEVFSASKAHLSKVLQRLSRVGIVKSVRGPKGGFVLAKPPEDVTLREVYEAIEGNLEPVDCLLDEPVCANTDCMLGDLLTSINRQVREKFSQTNLADLAGTFACVDASSDRNAGNGA